MMIYDGNDEEFAYGGEVFFKLPTQAPAVLGAFVRCGRFLFCFLFAVEVVSVSSSLCL
jgi:hypothetical protein